MHENPGFAKKCLSRRFRLACLALSILCLSLAGGYQSARTEPDPNAVDAHAAAHTSESPTTKHVAPKPNAIPEAVYNAIARATLPEAATADQLAAREAQVKTFVASNGGDRIYEGYLAEYGPPPDKRHWYIAATEDTTTRQLGFYYITHPLTNGPDVAFIDCEATPVQLSIDPTLRGLCGLSQWDAYQMSGDKRYAQAMLKMADGFVAESANGKILWSMPVVPAFGITKAPWISALTQSVAISTLLRAYQYTGNQRYKNAATAAFRWLTVPVNRGGLRSTDIGTWLEEYPTQDSKMKNGHVLNGNIWALFGVWDYYRVTRDSKAKALFDAGVQAIKRNMDWFDLGYWSVYSHQDRVSTVNGLYMQFIVQQMYAIARITRDPFFDAIAHKWERAQATDALFVHNIALAFLAQTPR
ncbi:D-glucuronyl C5-epimerase family protein [Trinickia sp.]|uniref:D-glucuronyl C5-epimerase family protein n=1 Tax=Trinickia sp. TaxID=2571163 RepID=UPI003F7F6428